MKAVLAVSLTIFTFWADRMTLVTSLIQSPCGTVGLREERTCHLSSAAVRAQCASSSLASLSCPALAILETMRGRQQEMEEYPCLAALKFS